MRQASLIICLFFASCYSYDGPVRDKYITPPPPKTEPLPPTKISSQDYLNQMAGAITKALPESQVQILEDSIKVLFPDNIRFSESSIIPQEDIYIQMKKLASLINRFSQTNVLVTGHTDNTGDAQTNKYLSEMRAKYIYDMLVNYKVDDSRLSSWGLGGSSPIATNDSEEGRRMNRRVEFIILSTIID